MMGIWRGSILYTQMKKEAEDGLIYKDKLR
jgi:hypothetical protein